VIYIHKNTSRDILYGLEEEQEDWLLAREHKTARLMMRVLFILKFEVFVHKVLRRDAQLFDILCTFASFSGKNRPFLFERSSQSQKRPCVDMSVRLSGLVSALKPLDRFSENSIIREALLDTSDFWPHTSIVRPVYIRPYIEFSMHTIHRFTCFK
jgi:hypothetical protein